MKTAGGFSRRQYKAYPALYARRWGCGLLALMYLAPYTFRVVISNKRILKLEDERESFRYQATDTGRERLCILAADEIIHHILQHVLPKGFVKVRYFGYFAPGCRWLSFWMYKL